MGMRDSGGEAASLREAPLPQTPSPEEWLGFELVLSFIQYAPASWARVPVAWFSPRRLTEPPRTCGVEDAASFASFDVLRVDERFFCFWGLAGRCGERVCFGADDLRIF